MASPAFVGSMAASAQSSLAQAREDRLMQQMQAGQGGVEDGKIEKGAKEFESMLLSTWLQQAEQSMATVPGAEDGEDTSGRDQMMSLGVQSLSTAMVASGGIGIASMITKAMRANAEKQASVSDSTAISAESAKTPGKN